MTFALFDRPAEEPSRFVGFAGNRIDRQAENRSETALADALSDPRLSVLILQGGRLYLKMNGAGPDCRFSASEATGLKAKLQHAVLLGHGANGPVIAAPGGLEPEDLPAAIKAIDLRSLNSQGLLGPEDIGAVGQGASLLAWNANCRFCGRCGAATEARIGGYKCVCTGCGAQHFPRTDPVVIMLTVTQERCLMGRSPHFVPGMFSTLAGFVEPGETIEDAVRRETLEESGVRVGRVAYHASQPWPFPHSLMIGCFGEAMNEDLTPDFTELEACRWFTRDEVRSMIAGTHPDGLIVPPDAAIANHLIRAWVDS
ncbi:NAD(+) diphosphatase [Aliihoeflea sp. 40Bstr573]|uniref:NAD(+) diphosphatase n=1 Tax=Aliihoeflea sp. 40Bstr573 TaxID=2696467 RepID=UPI0020956293|nr:NAD(+) diphosphatase [Aliihoeflea sp. 40Bstr573]